MRATLIFLILDSTVLKGLEQSDIFRAIDNDANEDLKI